MKKILLILSAVCCTAFAENLTAKDGSVYKNVMIISAKPDLMLIVHDGGGCQVYFKDLEPDALTTKQRAVVERELKDYAARIARLEKAKMERETFERTQREKGLIEFEGDWMTSLEKEELLLKREELNLELERQKVQLARERVALENERMKTEQARLLLEGQTPSRTIFQVGYTSAFYGSRGYGCFFEQGRDCVDRNGYKPSLYSRHNQACPPEGRSRTYIDPGRARSYSSGIFNH